MTSLDMILQNMIIQNMLISHALIQRYDRLREPLRGVREFTAFSEKLDFAVVYGR